MIVDQRQSSVIGSFPMLSGACVEREQIIVCAYDRVSYNDLGVGLVASSCGGSRPEQVEYLLSYHYISF